MRSISRLGRRLILSASFVALVLGATGCGPDCEGLCNDLFDICARASTCTALPPGDRDDIADACEELGGDIGLCVQGCDALDDDTGELLESLVDFSNQALVDVGC